MFIEFTHEEVKPYKDIKKLYRNTNLKDGDKVIVVYFKILEIFSYDIYLLSNNCQLVFLLKLCYTLSVIGKGVTILCGHGFGKFSSRK